ncbi:Zinc_finger C2H2-type [Hexamita inflata]|uniref:Zinc finger C2H2-type n=1 Tax=Hexamita inflata TaxID=28002 RepID=A0AA86QXH4_9EUKA|nr:Zinc finger C2H2-type [Hexamita inflata]
MVHPQQYLNPNQYRQQSPVIFVEPEQFQDQNDDSKSRLTCQQCGQQFKTRTELFNHLHAERHLQKQDNSKKDRINLEKPYKPVDNQIICRHCQYHCQSQADLMTHLKKSHPLKEDECRDCHQTFSCHAQLMDHVKTAHTKSISKPEVSKNDTAKPKARKPEPLVFTVDDARELIKIIEQKYKIKQSDFMHGNPSISIMATGRQRMSFTADPKYAEQLKQDPDFNKFLKKDEQSAPIVQKQPELYEAKIACKDPEHAIKYIENITKQNRGVFISGEPRIVQLQPNQYHLFFKVNKDFEDLIKLVVAKYILEIAEKVEKKALTAPVEERKTPVKTVAKTIGQKKTIEIQLQTAPPGSGPQLKQYFEAQLKEKVQIQIEQNILRVQCDEKHFDEVQGRILAVRILNSPLQFAVK